ncbi:predicted lysine methyltransferase [Pseudozyma hubeiensis SY62]|uniref:Predicted lysine methyltransferase n=1 Tax=Pseudozyma hubeiensis (strain SY62) TaxID=1305764 RepID=R9P7I2_PSEHS|nr:predicted lysine methyltransferase [Pseudozyma hubeiensis SY62]GAC97294.1 predicted lysine methyltransferase [Pseudozyma hubeiensis SY62]
MKGRASARSTRKVSNEGSTRTQLRVSPPQSTEELAETTKLFAFFFWKSLSVLLLLLLLTPQRASSQRSTPARMEQPQHPLIQWFCIVGIQLHPDLYLHNDPLTGLSFYTSSPLPRDTTVIRVPSELCITSTSAFDQIQQLARSLGSGLQLEYEALPSADWILLYLVLSRIALEYLSSAKDEALEKVFAHLPYVEHIPRVIETPLHFSSAELALLSNTPLVGSTERRLLETIKDYTRATTLLLPHLSPSHSSFSRHLCSVFASIDPEALQADSLMQHTYHQALELWRWSESAFTSRSFPPRLINVQDPTPILIPGYDTFNHSRAKPVTWSHTPTEEKGMVEMTLNYEVEGATQVWNNYGGKSNEEFLSGYGFTVEGGEEDTLALKVGGSGEHGRTHYWVLHAPESDTEAAEGGFVKASCPCPSLLDELEHVVRQDDAPAREDEVEVYGQVLELLESLLLAKRKAFRISQKHFESIPTPTYKSLNQLPSCPRIEPESPETSIRPSLWLNVKRYRDGQMTLLNSAVQWTRSELEHVTDWLDTQDEQR